MRGEGNPTPAEQQSAQSTVCTVALVNEAIAALSSLCAELVSVRQSMEQYFEAVNMERDHLMNTAEAADYCGRSRQTINRWSREKKIKKVIRGGRTGYLKSALDKVQDI